MKFIIRGEVKPQGRARHRVVKTKDGRVFGQTYEKKEDAQNKGNIRAQVIDQMQTQEGEIIKRPNGVSLGIHVTKLRPKSHYDPKGNIKQKFLRIPYVSRPDHDNLTKAIQDACNKILWEDDAQICRHFFIKDYGNIEQVEFHVDPVVEVM